MANETKVCTNGTNIRQSDRPIGLVKDGMNSFLNRIKSIHSPQNLTSSLSILALSLGTQYGILFLSQQLNIKTAALGLFGSEPPPKSIIMNHCAPLVRTPVYFIQEQNDEIHSEKNYQHLYESLGSTEKVLDSTPGTHQGVSLESLHHSCQFIAERIDAKKIQPHSSL